MNGDVVVEFTFKTLRNFTGALFHSNNLFSAGVEVFQAVDVHFGVDVGLSLEALKDAQHEQRRRDAILRPGQSTGPSLAPEPHQATHTLWSTDVISIEYEPDKKLETSRPVTVHLKQRLANKLRFVLKFASKWILVSEVEFLSHPVELLSFSDLADPHVRPLMGALLPAKSYDEYVAILREHQLRRIVTSAYMESLGVSSSTAVAEPADQLPNKDQPVSGESDLDQEFLAGLRRINGPAIPASSVSWQQQPATPIEPPANNPILSQPTLMFGPPPPSFSPPLGTSNSNIDAGQILSSPAGSESGGSSSQSRQPNSTSQNRKLGTATALSFVLLSILILIGLILGLTSYRYRHAAKSTHSSSLARHLQAPSKLGSSGLPFMSVFNNSATSSQTTSTSVGSTSANNHYNPLFATPFGATSARPYEHPTRALETLRRGLATLTGSQPDHTKANVDQNGFMHSLPPHQLLVSLKDQQHHQQQHGSKPRQQQVSTQLIVGLNQANPLARQQIYNSVGCPPGQIYSSLSMSMGSWSTTTNGAHQHLAEYDYAVPDVQAPALMHQHQHQQQQHQQQMAFNEI